MRFEWKKKLFSVGAIATMGAIALSVGTGIGLRMFSDTSNYGITADAAQTAGYCESGNNGFGYSEDDNHVITITEGSDVPAIHNYSIDQYGTYKKLNQDAQDNDLDIRNATSVVIEGLPEKVNFNVFNGDTYLRLKSIRFDCTNPAEIGAWEDFQSDFEYIQGLKIYVPTEAYNDYYEIFKNLPNALKLLVGHTGGSTKEYTEFETYPFTFHVYPDHVAIGDCDNEAATANIPGTIGEFLTTDKQKENAKRFFGDDAEKILALPVTEISEAAFDKCTKLTALTIPSSVKKICSSAFWGCEALTKINVPSSVTDIEASAFSNCTALKDIYIFSKTITIDKSKATICNGSKNGSYFFNGAIHGWMYEKTDVLSGSYNYANGNKYTFIPFETDPSGLDDDPAVTTTSPNSEPEVTTTTTVSDPWKEDIKGNSPGTSGDVNYWDEDADLRFEDGVVYWRPKKGAQVYKVYKMYKAVAPDSDEYMYDEDGEIIINTSSGSPVYPTGGDELSYQLASVPSDGFTVFVRAFKTDTKGEYVDSPKLDIAPTTLGAPGAPEIDAKNHVTWAAAPNAQAYALVMVKGSNETLAAITFTNEVTLPKVPKTQYSMYVIAYESDEIYEDYYQDDEMYTFIKGETSNFNTDKLGYAKAPTVTYDEKGKPTATWEAVPNAKDYRLIKTVNNTANTTAKTNGRLSGTIAVVPKVQYYLSVRAIDAKGNYTDGDKTLCAADSLGYVGAPDVTFAGDEVAVDFESIPGVWEYVVASKHGDIITYSDPIKDSYEEEYDEDGNLLSEFSSEMLTQFIPIPKAPADVWIIAYADPDHEVYTEGKHTVFGKTTLGKPGIPSLEKVDGKLVASWTEAENAEEYVIIKSYGGNDYFGKPTPDTSYTLEKDTSVEYDIWVRAYDNFGGYVDGDKLHVEEEKLGVAEAPYRKDDSNKIYWKPVENADKYYVVKTYVGSNGKTVTGASAPIKETGKDEYSYTLNKLPANKQVHLSIRAKNAKSQTDGEELVTMPDSKLGTVSKLSISAKGRVTWTKVNNAVKYEIVYTTGDTTKTQKASSGRTIKFTAGRKYTVYIKAYDKNGNYTEGVKKNYKCGAMFSLMTPKSNNNKLTLTFKNGVPESKKSFYTVSGYKVTNVNVKGNRVTLKLNKKPIRNKDIKVTYKTDTKFTIKAKVR